MKYTQKTFGKEEEDNLSAEQLLRQLVNQQKRMYLAYESFARASGFRAEVTESQQMHKDFWLYGFVKQLEYTTLSKENKIALLPGSLSDSPQAARNRRLTTTRQHTSVTTRLYLV